MDSLTEMAKLKEVRNENNLNTGNLNNEFIDVPKLPTEINN